MPRFLLIEFDDNAQADALRAQIDAATAKGKKFRVVGLFAKPPAPYCACPPKTQISTAVRRSSLKRGKRFGWWVCQICKRPAQNNSSLVNLMKPKDIIGLSYWDNWSYRWFHFIGYLPMATESTIQEAMMNQE